LVLTIQESRKFYSVNFSIFVINYLQIVFNFKKQIGNKMTLK